MREITTHSVFDMIEQQNDEKIAVYTENKNISYGKLRKHIWKMVCFLKKLEVKPGDSILVFMPNCIEYAVIFLAALKLNINVAPANCQMKDIDLAQLIEKIDIKIAFVLSEEQMLLVYSVKKSLPVYKITLEKMAGKDFVEDSGREYLENEIKAGVYLSTSGSTGRLKFVSNTYKNEILNAALYTNRMNITEKDVILTGLPITQKFGMAAMLGSFLSGAQLVMVSHFEAGKILSFIEKYKVSVQYGVPTIYIREMHAYDKQKNRPDITSLRVGIIAGASGNRDVFEWFENVAGCRLLNCYGASEVGGITMTQYEDSREVRYTSCGSLFDGARIEIVDEKGNRIPSGEIGEVWCSSPWIMEEYFGDQELTRQVLDENGKFHTGDIGKIDENDNFIFCGRKKELIIRGGFNVFPKEIESALFKYDFISECCVMGYKDACLGERICAFVSLKEGKNISDTAIREQLKKKISKYKLPDKVIIMQEIPKLPNGKIHRPILKEMLSQIK